MKKNKKIIAISVLLIIAGLVMIFANQTFRVEAENSESISTARISDPELETGYLPGETITPVTPYPVKTAAYWTRPIMNDGDVNNLARHDIVIIDLENQFNNRWALLRLKSLNPKIKLLPYSNPMEIHAPGSMGLANRPWQQAVVRELTENRSSWFLKTLTYSDDKTLNLDYAQYYRNMLMLNLSASCPKINGETYGEWMAKKIRQDILADSIWDGYFLDNGHDNISWVNSANPNRFMDVNNDRRPDTNEFTDSEWAKGMSLYLRLINQPEPPAPVAKRGFWARLFKRKEIQTQPPAQRRDYRNFIVISNTGSLSFLQDVKGKFFEKFPNDYLGDKWAGGWWQSIKNAELTGPFTIFNVNTPDQEINFALASALLLDNVYVSVGQDNSGYFPAFDLNIGKPLEKYRTEGGIYERKYENGLVRVNPVAKIGEILIN